MAKTTRKKQKIPPKTASMLTKQQKSGEKSKETIESVHLAKIAKSSAGKGSNENPLDIKKQELNTDETGEPIDDDLAGVITNLKQKGMLDEKI